MIRRVLLLHPSRLEGENRGVYEQHVASMIALLGTSPGWEVHALDLTHPSFPQAALAAELVIVHMLAAPEIEAVIRLRRARGLATIYEISDNFLDLGTWLPARHALRYPLVRQRIVYHASIADAVQVYAPGLAELCRHLNPRVLQLDPYVPVDRSRKRDGGFVVGWGGTTSHEEDLAAIAPAIVDFCRGHEDVIFAYIGNLSMGKRLFGGISPQQTRMREFSDHATYLDFVRTWHVGLAPLRPSAFNAARTDTKVATYAACRVAPVVEDCDVYRVHADHAVLYRDGELGETLESLYQQRARVDETAARASEWAGRERGVERLRAQRIAEYEPFCRSETGAPMSIASDAPSLEANVEGLRAIIRDHPDYAQARLALSDLLKSTGDRRGALEILDAHPFPEVFAGIAAERQFALALSVCPERVAEYAARVDSPAARVRIAHRQSERGVFLRALLEEQPFDYFALSTMLRELLGQNGDTEELRAICARICLIAPELVPSSLRPESLLRFLPA